MKSECKQCDVRVLCLLPGLPELLVWSGANAPSAACSRGEGAQRERGVREELSGRVSGRLGGLSVVYLSAGID